MKHICHLNDRILLGQPGRSYRRPRITARAILKDRSGRYALLYAEKFRLYSLPGGGVEPGEEIVDALRREVLEETGCHCDEIRELGIITENRACQDFTQKSHYFVVTTNRRAEGNHLTQAERANGTQVRWHTLEEVLRLISAPEHTTVQRKYLQARDMAALREYSRWLQEEERT